LHANIGVHAWGDGEDDLAALLVDALRANGKTLAVAESCTGGLLGARLTEVPGASEAFLGGVLAYADAAKRELLAVDQRLLADHGAVSGQVSEAMALGAASRLGADLAVSITGIAGPGGGSPDKPVGTVWVAFLVDGALTSQRMQFSGDRTEVRARAVQAALFGLWRRLTSANPALR